MTSTFDTFDSTGRNLAACRENGIDPDTFFDPVLVMVAQDVCFGCPLRLPCAQYALAEDIREGVWGGLSEYERQSIQRKRRRNSK